MPTLEDVFKQEFKKTVEKLYANKSVYDLPNPLEGVLGVLTEKVYRVEGIAEDSPYAVLNDLVVYDMGRVKAETHIEGRDGKPMRDVDNKVIREPARTPSGSVWIRSKTRVNVPRKDDHLVGYNSALAWVEGNSEYKYVYALPKDVLYRVNVCALAVSSRKLKAYKGFALTTWAHGKITVAVIPFSPTQKYQNTVILGTKGTDDFDAEMKHYVDTLIHKGIVPAPNFFHIDGGMGNLVVNEIEPAFEGYEGNSIISLAEEGALTYAKAASLADEEPEIEWED